MNELEGAELATSSQPGKVAFVVFDSRLASLVATVDADAPPSRDGWFREGTMALSTFPEIGYAYVEDYRQRTEYFTEAADAPGLAEFIQAPVSAVQRTLERLNHAADGRAPDPFGRDFSCVGSFTPPFYALGPIKAVLGSSGGLKVDRKMRVLDAEGRPIHRLSAAGMTGSSNVLIAGHGHALAWTFATGRIAGANAAACAGV